MGKKNLTTRTTDYMLDNLIVRVMLEDVLQFFTATTGETFRSLPQLSRRELTPEYKARNEVPGWVVPPTSYGRLWDRAQRDGVEPIPTRSTAITIAAWIHDRLLPSIAAVGGPVIDPETVSVHLEGEGEYAQVVIYRRK